MAAEKWEVPQSMYTYILNLKSELTGENDVWTNTIQLFVTRGRKIVTKLQNIYGNDNIISLLLFI